MAFRFKVQRVNYLQSVNLYILDAMVDPEARVFIGSIGTLASNPSRQVKITGIGSHRGADGTFSITIAPPDFPLSELEGAVIVGD